LNAIVVGAGLAGCEAAHQIANAGISVTLYEMKPKSKTPAHHSDNFCELVCSNSLRSNSLTNAVGLLKEELRILCSLVIDCADKTRVPAGGSLAVDREDFSGLVTKIIKENPLITIIEEEINEIPKADVVIIATGPLTTENLANNIKDRFGQNELYFFDAAAPIVTFDSIDMNKAYFASRYDKGTPDYINCPMEKEEYEVFYNELVNAETAELKEFDKEQLKVFEGCMPVEVMAKRGINTLLFGPLKPVGLKNPYTNKEPYAVVQLRKDNKEGTLYNLVGFQTQLKFPEQKRVFSLIPSLENVEFIRYGVMHRNTFLNSPLLLDNTYAVKKQQNIFFAGQITGVEGYVESVASGFVAGVNAVRFLQKKEKIIFPKQTAIGALANYISDESVKNFQPMNINFSLFPPLEKRIRNKKERYLDISNRSLALLMEKKYV